jgi:hypothetical protein
MGNSSAAAAPAKKGGVMNAKQIGVSVLLVDFLTLTGYAV